VFAIWLGGALLSMMFALGIGLVIQQFVNESGDGSAPATWIIAGGFGSMLGFLVACLVGLRSIRHDRFVNAMGVAAVHIALLLVVTIVSGILSLTTGSGLSDTIGSGSNFMEASVGFFALERSAITAVAGCLLAAALMPSRGDVPGGTQSGHPDAAHTL